ncbi:restriction endonuclease [Luteimonas salinilitoris]|uniref:Restriction endonuclease n=1 Tax=Luteimonas salinilitoris TaxID=3237697 RepID=A0ABV4HXQ1_9GAMM
MARRKQSALEALATLPWPAGIAAGILGFLAIRHGIAWWMGQSSGPLGQAFAQQAPAFAPIAWAVLALCWGAALASWLGRRKRRRLLDTRTGLDSLAALGWREFELLVGEAFRRQGYVVEETGLGGADGGIDLILRRHGRRNLVQCKQWRRRQVPVSVVREMYGLLAHHGADAVLIASLGPFTRDAERFAAGKPIELIEGEMLLRMIHEVQVTSAQPRPIHERIEPVLAPAELAAAPECPSCGKAMVERKNRRSGEVFLGCSGFPACRGTR